MNTKIKKNKHFKDPVIKDDKPKNDENCGNGENGENSKSDNDTLVNLDSKKNAKLDSNDNHKKENPSKSVDRSSFSGNESELLQKLDPFINSTTPVYVDENIIKKITANQEELSLNLENSYENSLISINKFIESIKDYHTLNHYSNKDNKDNSLKPSKDVKFKIEEFYVKLNIQYFIEHLLTIPNYMMIFKKLSIFDGIRKLIKEVKNIMTNSKLTYIYKQIDHLIDGLYYDLKYLLEMSLLVIEMSVIY